MLRSLSSGSGPASGWYGMGSSRITLGLMVLLAALLLPVSALDLKASGAHAATPAQKSDDNRYGGVAKRRKTLDGLFMDLKRASDGFIAQSLIQQIWLNWHQSGRRDVDDLLSRAKINAGEGEFDAAIRKFDKLNRLAPTFAEGWNGRATVLYQMGRYAESLAAIEITLKYEPRHFGALAGRGLIYFRQEKFAQSLKAFEAALKHNPHISEQQTIMPALRRKLGIRDL